MKDIEISVTYLSIVITLFFYVILGRQLSCSRVSQGVGPEQVGKMGARVRDIYGTLPRLPRQMILPP